MVLGLMVAAEAKEKGVTKSGLTEEVVKASRATIQNALDRTSICVA